MFLLSLLVCGISLMVPDAVILYPLAWLAFFMLRANNWRCYSASIIAILTVFIYFALAYAVWKDSVFVHYVLTRWAGAFERTWRCWEVYPIWLLAVNGIVFIVGLWSLIAHLQRYSRANVRIQTRVLLVAPPFFASLIAMLLPPLSGNTLIAMFWCSSIYLTVLYLMTYGFPKVNLRGNGGSTTRRLSRRADSQNPFLRKKKQTVYGNSRRSFSRRSRRR